MADDNSKPLICIVGPTGAGKSELAIRMAESLDGEIVNCDSMQIYKGFDIGTAKIPLSERRGIVHHLIDIAQPWQLFTAGEYSRQARRIMADISARGKVPIVAGGTGFYLRALLEGLPSLPERNEKLRTRLLRLRSAPHQILSRLDQAAARRIHPNDSPKVIRALEVRLLTGRRSGDQTPADPLRGYQTRKIGLFPPRLDLYERLNRRCRWMFDYGLVEEVEGLLRAGVPESAKPFESLGYKQALAVLKGSMNREEGIAVAQQATRNYAKRQITWFRHEPGVEIWTSSSSCS